jgi:hypothetical protein
VTLGQGKLFHVPTSLTGGSGPGTYTRELFFRFNNNADIFQKYSCEQWGTNAYLSFYIPNDFTALVQALVILIFSSTGSSRRVQFDTLYGKDLEAYNQHSETDTTSGHVLTANRFYSFSVASVLTGIEADDRVGLNINQIDDWGAPYVLGLLLRYN